MANEFVGLWKPITAGEVLLHFLANNVADFETLDSKSSGSGKNTGFSTLSRGDDLRMFFEGCLILHCFGRSVQAAKFFRMNNDSDEAAIQKIRIFSIDKLGLSGSSCTNFDSLPLLAFEAARSSSDASKTPNNHVKNQTLTYRNGQFHCYSCGKDLDPNIEKSAKLIDAAGNTRLVDNSTYLDYEHLWPHSMGGDSVAANLLPSCLFCNREKNDLVSWEWGLIQSAIPKYDLFKNTLSESLITKREKISLHMRQIFHHARQFGTTLKDAAEVVGPRIMGDVTIIDPDDTADFFNLRIHDPARLQGTTGSIP